MQRPEVWAEPRDVGSTHIGPWVRTADLLENEKTSLVASEGRLSVDRGQVMQGCLGCIFIYQGLGDLLYAQKNDGIDKLMQWYETTSLAFKKIWVWTGLFTQSTEGVSVEVMAEKVDKQMI